MRVNVYALFLLLLLSHWGLAQTATVSGVVTDGQTKEPLPGVAIKVKNASRGTLTDLDGNYQLQVSATDTLQFSFLGYAIKEVAVGNKKTIDVQLMPDEETLTEVVVVGYGEQKKSVVTGAISSVKAADLESMPINRVEQALQGRTSGLTIAASSGQPGSGATVRVRGITSLSEGANNPLWVVDGVVVDNGGIGYINQSDIASIEVLKDAASQAIYGARAAAGVILVTTKKGQAGGIRLNYNGFYGTSAPARKIGLTNATAYATLRNEASVAAGKGIVFQDPAAFGAGTDWQKAIFNEDARRQNHELSISGGNEVSTFYASFGYLDQEGIVASDISQYTRTNLRLNSTHKVAKWLTLGQNLGYAHDKSVGIGNTNSEFGGPLSSAINLDPLTPLVELDPDKANAGFYLNEGVVRDANGNPYGISNEVGQELVNPLAYVQTRLGNYGWSDNIVGNAYLEAKPIEGLQLRSTLGGKLAYWGVESFTPVFWLNASTNTTQTSFHRGLNQRIDWNLENTISYSKSMGSHNASLLLGQGAYKDSRTMGVSLTKFDIPVDNFDDASMNYGVPVSATDPAAFEGAIHTVTSLFARLNYNYKEKYMLSAIARRDGSSRFGANNRYGYFPSASLGWVASHEDFWPKNQVVNFLKIRGSYGVVGNDNIGDFAYLSTISPGRNYTLGTSGDYVIGYSPDAPSNPDLKWEETAQTNVGFEATFLKHFSMTFDWYQKITTGILQPRRIPGYVGAIANPWANVADLKNQGYELELGYNNTFGDLSLSFNGNLSYMQNKVTYLGDGIEFLDGGQTFQASTYPITRTAVGQPANSFYGFKTLGIFQTPEQVAAYVNKEGTPIQPNAMPGDFIWEDRDGDGAITDKDRSFIGNPTPDWSFGLTTSAKYKDFDLMVFAQGVAGNQIFQGLRRLDVANANYSSRALGRWTGPGSTNEYPRLHADDPNKNFSNPSTFYLEDGDYFRIKILQLGYTLPRHLSSKIGLGKARIYLMGENLFTFTNYTGYDPEIGGGVMSIDRGIYPQARSLMVGVNLGF